MNTRKVKANKDDDLFIFMPGVIESLKRNLQFPAVQTYTSTLHSVGAFLESDAIAMHCIFTPEQITRYENWLERQGLEPNTISTYLRTLQAVYNRWAPPGTPEHNPKLFKEAYTRIESSTKRALTREQVQKLFATNVDTLAPNQQRTLAYFLLMFLLRGMPFIDLAHLRKTDVRHGTITYLRHKTGKPIVVDIPREAWALLNKYRDKTDSVYLLPILKDKDTQDAMEQFLDYKSALRKYNRALAGVIRILLPGVRVSSYTARHTWATLAYYMGTPVGIISQSMGHSSLLVTMTYLKPFGNTELDKVNRQVISSVRKGKWKKWKAYSIVDNRILR
ncbi:tyrosine-type recombinase/integrase [Bacteroides sp.]|uniref:tyrosine-type recombinase/integrase n=1 Tax=Bacteroides sp. TaxID=29523 RepID=UPI002605A803|nr:tyrosine-type recombinase/integrase [Bacteroides sp.]